MISRGVSDARVMKEVADAGGAALQHAEVRPRGFRQVRFGARRYFHGDAELESAVEILVRIELRGIRRQMEHRDLAGMRRHPGADLGRLVHIQVVEDQGDFAVARM